MTHEYVRVDAGRLASVVRDALTGVGVPPHIVSVEADLMVEAELCGVPSHGILMLPRLLSAVRDGRADPSPVLALLRDRGAMCVLDGGNGPGRYVSICAMDHAVARAGAFGIGACLAVRTTHWGRAHAYACHAARQGMIGLCTTNAIPSIATPGSSRPILGNNPLAIGIPRIGGGDPVVLDIAMSQAAFGKVATYRREGRQVPGDWGLDTDGRPTGDAAAILASGMLLPTGGHKGFGLALMMELLTAGLAGGIFGHEMLERDRSGLDPDASKLFIAIDVAAFGDRAGLSRRIDDLVAWVRDAAPDAGMLAPGERGWQTRERYLVEGIPIHAGVIEQLKAAGVRIEAM